MSADDELIELLTRQAREGDEAVEALARVESLLRSCRRRRQRLIDTDMIRRALDGDS